jgi:hypothetical protein
VEVNTRLWGCTRVGRNVRLISKRKAKRQAKVHQQQLHDFTKTGHGRTINRINEIRKGGKSAVGLKHNRHAQQIIHLCTCAHKSKQGYEFDETKHQP